MIYWFGFKIYKKCGLHFFISGDIVHRSNYHSATHKLNLYSTSTIGAPESIYLSKSLRIGFTSKPRIVGYFV